MSDQHELAGGSAADGESLGLLFAANPLPMWLYDLETLAFLEVNSAAVARYGYSRDEFLQMRITDIRPEEDLERLLADVRTDRSSLQYSRQWRHRLRSGQIISVEIASHTLTFRGRSAVFVVVHDVTERTAQLEAAVAQARASEARHRSLIQGASYGIYRATAHGRFLEVNPALVEMLGYDSAAEILALRHTAAIFHDRALRSRLVEECTRLGRIDGVEVSWRRKDGALLSVRLSGRAVRDERGVVTEFEVMAEDVTERRRLEQQLRQAQKMDAVGQLAGGIAHNFNNLLMSILGHTELLLARGGPKAPEREDLEQIQKAGERAAVLTRQLLAFSRKQLPAPRDVDVNHTVNDLRRMLRRLIREDISITCDLGRTPALIRIDPHEIEQVILNLVLNARDALPAGGRIHLEVARVRVSADADETSDAPPRDDPSEQGEYVRLRVADNGTGMSEEVRAHLFEPFFTTKEPGKGTGLGLASVYGIVRHGGGVIAVDSAPGAGTTVTIHFPALPASVVAPVAAADAMRPSGARGHEMILLVEDEDAVRGVIGTALREHGYRVLEASRPSGASKLFALHAGEIDLLLTDVIMPEMDGPALAQCFVAVRPELQVLFISGYAESSSLGFANPKVSFLSKPIQPSVLANKVREILDRDRRVA